MTMMAGGRRGEAKCLPDGELGGSFGELGELVTRRHCL